MNAGRSVLAVPFYSQQLQRRGSLPSCAAFDGGEGGLTKDCVAKADELGVLDKALLDLAAGPLGRFNESQMQRLMQAVAWMLGLRE